jgi:predicted nicotinamide N-methyase
MEWVLGNFNYRGKRFLCWHFDACNEAVTAEAENSAELCQGVRAEELPETATEEIGAVLWLEAAEACLHWLERSRSSYRGWNVLELGAGCGFVGLALATDGAQVRPPRTITPNTVAE